MESAEFNYCGYRYCCHHSGFSMLVLYQLFSNRRFFLLDTQITETLFTDSTILACPAIHIKSHRDTSYKTYQHNILPVFSVNNSRSCPPSCFLFRIQTIPYLTAFSHRICLFWFYFSIARQTAGIWVLPYIQDKRV